MSDSVWAITTIERQPGPRLLRASRTVGIFQSQERAHRILEQNLGDLEEAGHYQFAVVEEVPFGLYGLPEETAIRRATWWEWCVDRWVSLFAEPAVLIAERGGLSMIGWSSIG